MAMSTAYLNLTADAGRAAITHVGLVDETGTEISGGTYARQAVAWVAAVDGKIVPTADKTFNIPANKKVAGWRGYSALTNGTDYGGGALPEQPFASDGTYTLLAAQTYIDHDAVA